jgi:hypothetical protein
MVRVAPSVDFNDQRVRVPWPMVPYLHWPLCGRPAVRELDGHQFCVDHAPGWPRDDRP